MGRLGRPVDRSGAREELAEAELLSTAKSS